MTEMTEEEVKKWTKTLRRITRELQRVIAEDAEVRALLARRDDLPPSDDLNAFVESAPRCWETINGWICICEGEEER